jgi:outer membrane protein assembly factor BamE (lipoprotein component of BamABCDE complex)
MTLRPSLAALFLVAACAASGPPRTDSTFSQLRVGMTQDEVRRIAGPPDERMPFPMLKSDSWAWYGYDTWGYYVLFSATFGPDGKVASTFTRRLNDGGEMK